METCTAGAAGGPGKPTGSNPGRAPRSDPTLHDHTAYPARLLAQAYHWRWIGSETCLREAKSAISGAGPSTGPMLRSASPAGRDRDRRGGAGGGAGQLDGGHPGGVLLGDQGR